MQAEDQLYDEAQGPTSPKGPLHEIRNTGFQPLWRDINELSEEEYRSYLNKIRHRASAA